MTETDKPLTAPFYADESVTVHAGDCLDVLASLPDASVDAVVTDPPYNLGFMGMAWDTLDGRDGEGQRRDRRNAFDHVGGNHNPTNAADAARTRRAENGRFEEWCWAWAVECLRVLKPGGYLLAFGGTRTYHRMACAIEDAGFELRDSITWLYGSGFPKSLDVSKAIHAHQTTGGSSRTQNRRAALGTEYEPYAGVGSAGTRGSTTTDTTAGGTAPKNNDPTDDARRWEGWGAALKPSFEPVVWARKPFSAVPLDWRLVAAVHHALSGLLWLSLSPARRAELDSTSRNPEPPGAWCASARVAAAMGTSPDASVATATYSSPATASTSSSIASSWNAILAALSDPTRTSTTATRSSTTTALRTLYSLLGPLTSQTTMPPCECLQPGPGSSALSAGQASIEEWASWLAILRRSVPGPAIEGIGLAVASALAQVVELLSGGPAAASSADQPATTGAGGSSSPAQEPVVVARKPLAGTVAQNVVAYGTGALNIAGSRVNPGEAVPGGGGFRGGATSRHEGWTRPSHASGYAIEAHDAGRWPTNVVLSHAPQLDDAGTVVGDACADGCVDGCPVAELDRQSGRLRARGNLAPTTCGGGLYGYGVTTVDHGPGDAGGASRFFPVFRYEAKADSNERPRADGVAHPTVKPLDLMRWLVRLVTPPGGVVLEPFAGSGTTAEACVVEGFRCVAIEREPTYLPLIVARLSKPLQPVLGVG